MPKPIIRRVSLAAGERFVKGGEHYFPRFLSVEAFLASPPLDLEAELEVTDQGPLCRALTVRSRDPRVGVKAAHLRQIAMEELVRDAVASWAWKGKREGRFTTYTLATAEERAALRSSGRRGEALGDDHYRRVAEVYREGLRLGEHPTEHVRRRLNHSKSTAARWVMEARRRGFLGRTQPGVAGEIREEDE